MRFFEQELHVNIGEFFNVVYPISKLFNEFMERIKGTLAIICLPGRSILILFK